MPDQPPSRAARWLPIVLPLLAGLLLRLALWGRLPRTGLISDEGEYLAAADWLAHGRGFAWYLGYLWTRVPLYPLFVAAHARLFADPLPALFVTQGALSLLNVALVYTLARRALTGRGPMLAALLMALYLPLAAYTQIALSETLYLTLLLGGFLALAAARSGAGEQGGRGEAQRTLVLAIFAGILLGLATLTRSLTLGFLPLAALWLWWFRGSGVLRFQGSAVPLTFLLAAGLTIAPWTIYSSRAYGGLVPLDTSGAYNLLLGARTAWDGGRSDAPTRDFVRALLDQQVKQGDRAALVADACLNRRNDPRLAAALQTPAAQIAQAQRQTLMTAEGLCLIAERPLAFARKSGGELLDFFRINYSGDERFTDGFTTGRLPRWYALALLLLDDTLYILALPLAVLGWWQLWRSGAPIAREQAGWRTWRTLRLGGSVSPAQQLAALIMLWWGYTIAVAPLLFAINRFRLPLLPFAFICVAALITKSLTADAVPPAPERAAASGAPLPPSRASARAPELKARAPRLIALLLWIIAAAPYAYLWPQDQALPSYLGPYPSSLSSTWLALTARPTYDRTQAFRAALATDPGTAARLLADGPVGLPRVAKQKGATDAQLAAALLVLAQSKPAVALAALPSSDPIMAAGDVEAALVRADALRASGDPAGARALFTPIFVDNANPVQWAWDWLRPAPARRIDLGGNLDLGYLRGCYLGEPVRAERTTFRWCTDGAQLRFPGAGRSTPQTLTLLADARGWPADLLPNPPVTVLVNGVAVGSFTPDIRAPQRYTLPVPATADGAELIVTLRMPTFVPDAARYLSQQGALVGQLQRLGVRLDTAELGP